MRSFPMRLHATFAGDDNAVQEIEVERFDGTAWSPLALSEKSPGFRIFTYSAFACLLVHLRMVGAERGLKLADTRATFELQAADDWVVEAVTAHFDARTRDGHVPPDAAETIVARMERCPVAKNLDRAKLALSVTLT